MKHVISFVLLLCVASISSAQELEGVWELVSGEYLDGEGKLINYDTVELRSLKILSPTHFSFTSAKGDKFWAAGSGTYKVVKGKYTEVLKYNSFGQNHGTEFVFDIKIDNEYWYNSRWEGETRVEYEVWRRVE